MSFGCFQKHLPLSSLLHVPSVITKIICAGWYTSGLRGTSTSTFQEAHISPVETDGLQQARYLHRPDSMALYFVCWEWFIGVIAIPSLAIHVYICLHDGYG